MKPKDLEHAVWLDLSEAADYLGVHFSTLRRWADAGEITFIRTPGGRRRFSITALDSFLQHRTHGLLAQPSIEQPPAALSSVSSILPLQEQAADQARRELHSLLVTENWLERLGEAQRLRMKNTGNQLMALLLQYNGRAEGGEAYLEEGRRITGEYGQVCAVLGFSLPETVRVFSLFRRSILDAIYQTGHLGGSVDFEGQRLFRRTNDFFDTLMISLIDNFLQSPLIGKPDAVNPPAPL